MSNQAAMQYQIDLQNFIDLNKNKSTVRQFEGFTKRNSPYINNGISPLFSNKDIQTDWILKDGRKVKIDNGTLKINDNSVMPISPKGMTLSIIKNKYEDYLYIPRDDNNELWVKKTAYLSNDEKSILWDYILNGTKYTHTIITNSSDIGYSFSFEILNNPGNDYDFFIYLYYYSSSTNYKAIYGLNFVNQSFNQKLLTNTIRYGYSFDNSGVIVYDAQSDNKYLYISNKKNQNGKIIGAVVTALKENNTDTSNYTIDDAFVNIEGEIHSTTLTNGIGSVEFGFFTHIVHYVNNSYTETYGNGKRTGSQKRSSSTGETFTYFSSKRDCIFTYKNNRIISCVTPVVLSNGETMYFYNENANGQVIDDAGNVSITDIFYFPFINSNNEIKYYGILYNNNYVSGISYNGILLYDFLSASDEIYNYGDKIVFYNEEKIYIIDLYGENSKILNILYDRYVLLNSNGDNNNYNGYDIYLDKPVMVFSDYNNRIIPTTPGTIYIPLDVTANYCVVGSGINVSYENNISSISSAQFGAQYYRYIKATNPAFDNEFTLKMPPNTDKMNVYDSIEIYYSSEVNTLPVYYKTLINNKKYKSEKKYIGTTYPVQTEGNILLNPTIFDTFYISGLMYDSIKTPDDNFYKLIYSDAQPVLLYAYSSNIKDVTDIFFIQGQLYVIRNDIICSAIIDGNNFESITPVINKGALKFLGCTPLVAYFYSETDRHIYTFSGDRNLSKYLEISEFTEIKDSIYLPDNNSLLLATDNGLYVIDSNSYIYSVEGNYNKVLPLNNGFAGLIGDKWNEYYYYNDAAEGKEKVKLRTSFYGVGSNQVDIIDTWYIRLYSDEKKAGEISCTVETITDKSTVSSTQKFLISASDWDKNGFIYIRYQPQLQRGIGTSLEIESDFSIYDLQASILPDNTKQLSADYKQEYNFVDSNGI